MSDKDDAKEFRQSLVRFGLSAKAVDAAWPAWWSEEAESSASARVELRFSVARNLGLDPRSLLEDPKQPRFVWRDEARFKHLLAESDVDKEALASFGRSVANILIMAAASSSFTVPAASELRRVLLNQGGSVSLTDLLAACWSLGIPVAYLRVFPRPAKRMVAMTTSVNERFAILLGREVAHPAQLSFYLAHELGHIALGHLRNNGGIVDLERSDSVDKDGEEDDADAYSLELLMGRSYSKVLPKQPRFTAGSLASSAIEAGRDLSINPGILALSFGHNTGRWKTVFSALKMIEPVSTPLWQEVNRFAWEQLEVSEIPGEQLDFLGEVLGRGAI